MDQQVGRIREKEGTKKLPGLRGQLSQTKRTRRINVEIKLENS